MENIQERMNQLHIYKIYIVLPKEIYNKLVPNFPELNEHRFVCSGLYAWTDSKKVVKEFFRLRNKEYFKVEKEYVDDDYLDDVNKNNEYLNKKRLLYIDYGIGQINKNISILSTIEESDICEDFALNIFYSLNMCDYMLFKESYITALDFISYTTQYDMNCLTDNDVNDSDEYDRRIETASDLMSYDMTVVCGKKCIDFTSNIFSAFLFLFNEILL